MVSDSTYNRLVDDFNKLVREKNYLVDENARIVKAHNEKVEDFNKRNGELVDKFNELNTEYKKVQGWLRDAKSELIVLADKYKELLIKHNDLSSDYEDMKEKYESARTDLQNEKLRHASNIGNEKLDSNQKQNRLLTENAKLQEKLESKSALMIQKDRRIENVEKELEDTKQELSLVRVEKENQVALIENKLDQKQQLLESVRQSLADLRVEHEREKAERDIEINQKNNQLNEKESELRRKEEEIKNLRSQKGQSQEELLAEKLRSEKENLKLFATELKIGLEQIQSLSKYHERLFLARKNRNQANVDLHEENIARTEEEFRQTGISVVNIREISRKCEEIAKIN